MNEFGHVRVTACSPVVTVGDPSINGHRMTLMLANGELAQSDIVVFPELAITGYTVADLFRSTTLLEETEKAVANMAFDSKYSHLLFVGAPVRVNGELFNCAIVINQGQIIGIVPKQYLPNYGEFYERRWFRAATLEHVGMLVNYGGQEDIPFGIDLLFRDSENSDLTVFAEICEDLFMPVPPSSIACMHGATVTVNLSASPETVAKADYRMELIRNQSGRCLMGYVYASAGPSESTTDLVFSGHCVVAENGSTLAESTHIGDGTLDFEERHVTADIDVSRCCTERQMQGTFSEGKQHFLAQYRVIKFVSENAPPKRNLKRKVAAMPFVPSDPKTLAARCAAVFDIQCAALAKRWSHLRFPDLHIGISGGLDSTHQLLVAVKTADAMCRPRSSIVCTTMPGFGTTQATKKIAVDLMRLTGVRTRQIDIRAACFQHWLDIGHSPFGLDLKVFMDGIGKYETIHDRMGEAVDQFSRLLKTLTREQREKGDLVFENTQARERTKILMNSGFVLGTGDMSELALGWCTYNADHMSMYNPNCGVPKTLIRFMVQYVADNHFDAGELRDALKESVGLVISPELLPPGMDGQILQSTEDMVGSYVLNDFYMFNFIRYGFDPEKILFLSSQCELAEKYDEKERRRTLERFISRFFDQQYKRTCVPDGPKVGTLSLSPRGDWRMPTDASSRIWLERAEGKR